VRNVSVPRAAYRRTASRSTSPYAPRRSSAPRSERATARGWRRSTPTCCINILRTARVPGATLRGGHLLLTPLACRAGSSASRTLYAVASLRNLARKPSRQICHTHTFLHLRCAGRGNAFEHAMCGAAGGPAVAGRHMQRCVIARRTRIQRNWADDKDSSKHFAHAAYLVSGNYLYMFYLDLSTATSLPSTRVPQTPLPPPPLSTTPPRSELGWSVASGGTRSAAKQSPCFSALACMAGATARAGRPYHCFPLPCGGAPWL